MRGHIETIFGPMFSGKSTELHRRVRRYKLAHGTCLVINFFEDNRYSSKEVSVTHDKCTMDAKKLKMLSELSKEDLKNHHVIGVDEGQFFPDLIECVDKWANMGKIVIVAALDSTFDRKPFGRVIELVPISESVDKLTAICVECKENAAFTFRTNTSHAVQLIGGEELYKPVCRKCYNNLKAKLSKTEKENCQNNIGNTNSRKSSINQYDDVIVKNLKIDDVKDKEEHSSVQNGEKIMQEIKKYIGSEVKTK